MSTGTRHRGAWLGVACLAALVIFAVVFDGGKSLLGALPYLLLLACALMHFMHGRHRKHTARPVSGDGNPPAMTPETPQVGGQQ